MSNPVTQNAYLVANATGTIYPTVTNTRAPTGSDMNFPVTQRWIDVSTVDNIEYFLLGFTSTGGIVQANWIVLNSGSSGAGIDFLEGNSGGPVGPNGSGIVNVVGDGSVVTVSGNPGTNTLTAAITGIVPPANGGTGVANPGAHRLPVSEGASAFNFLGPLTNGQLLIGSTGVDPVPATITAGSGITVTNGPGSITIAASGITDSITFVTTTPYTVLSTDEFLAVKESGSSITILMPNTTTTARVVYIKDTNGQASTFPIKITTPGGTTLFDGATAMTLSSNYASVGLIFDGTTYEVF